MTIDNIVVKTYVGGVEVTGSNIQLTTGSFVSVNVEFQSSSPPLSESFIMLETSDTNNSDNFVGAGEFYTSGWQSLGNNMYKGDFEISVDSSFYLGKSIYFRLNIYRNGNDYVYSTPVQLTDLYSISVTTQPSLPQTPLTLGANVTFTASATSLGGTLSYQWQKNDADIQGANQSTLTINNIQQSNTGYYRVRISSQYNSVNSNQVHIMLDNSTAPVITQNIVDYDNQSLTVTYGSTVMTLTLGLQDTTNISYTWFVNDSEQQDSNSASFQLQPSGPDTYTVYVVAKNIVSNLSVQSYTASFNVTPRIFILDSMYVNGDYKVKSGQNKTLTASVLGGNGTIMYQWKKNGINIGIESPSNTFTIMNATLLNEGSYSVVVRDSYDNAIRISTPVLIEVHTPIVITKQPLGIYAANGASVSLSCEVTGTHALYTWAVKRTNGTNVFIQRTMYDNSPTLTGTLNTSLSVDTWDGNGNDLPVGSYFCRVDNYNNMVDTNVVTVGVSTDGGVSEFNNGTLSDVPTAITLNGVQQIAVVKPVTTNAAIVTVDSTSTTRPQSVAFTNLRNDVAKVAVAVPEVVTNNSVTTVRLEINLFDSTGNKLSDFNANPVTLTVAMPSSFVGNTITVYTKDSANNTIDTNIFTKVPNSTKNEYTGQLKHFSPQEFVDNPNQSVPCFTAGTRIQTTNGNIPVEKLSSSDRIVTADGRIVPFKLYTTTIKKTTQNTAPYTIPANTFGHNSPAADITLSPLHAVQSRKGVWQIPKYAAKQYSAITQSRIGESVTYYHVELPNFFTDNIIAEGTVVESFGANQTTGIQNVYKYNSTLQGFTRVSQPLQSKRALLK